MILTNSSWYLLTSPSRHQIYVNDLKRKTIQEEGILIRNNMKHLNFKTIKVKAREYLSSLTNI